MSILKIKDKNGKWVEVPALVGPKGPQGIQGPKGDKPVKGVDYYTEADKQEIVNIVNDALSNFPIIDEIYIGTNEPAGKNRVWIKPI